MVHTERGKRRQGPSVQGDTIGHLDYSPELQLELSALLVVSVVNPMSQGLFYFALLILFNLLQQNRFAKCDLCVKIKMERSGCLQKNKQIQLKATLQEHLNKVE